MWAGIGVREFPWVDAGACLFRHYVGGSLLARLEQPGVVGTSPAGIKPSESSDLLTVWLILADFVANALREHRKGYSVRTGRRGRGQMWAVLYDDGTSLTTVSEPIARSLAEAERQRGHRVTIRRLDDDAENAPE